MNCPRCGCGRVSSNKHQPVPFGEIAPNVQALRRQGRTWLAGGTVFAWLAANTWNALTEDWRCDHCDHRFTV